MRSDVRGLAVSTDSDACVAALDAATASYMGFRADAAVHVNAALAADPACLMANVLKGGLTMLLSNAAYLGAVDARHDELAQRRVRVVGELLDDCVGTGGVAGDGQSYIGVGVVGESYQYIDRQAWVARTCPSDPPIFIDGPRSELRTREGEELGREGPDGGKLVDECGQFVENFVRRR